MTLFDSPLPEGWSWKAIASDFRITKKPRDVSVRNYDRIAFVPMDAIPLGGREPLRVEWRAPDALTSGTYFERGDVLLSKITPSFENGKQAIASSFPSSFGIGSTELIPIQSISEQAENRFLFYYLLHPEVRASLVARMEGSTGRQRVPEGAVRELVYPSAPHSEQLRIAAILWKVQRAIEVQEQLVVTVRELKQAAMRQFFTRGLRGEAQKETEIGMVPESWEVVPLGRLGRIGNGSTPKRDNEAFWSGGKIPWLNSGKIHEGVIEAADQFVTDFAVSECHLPMVRAGSILVAITGQGKTLGNVAKVNFDTTVNQHLAYLQFSDQQVEADFVRYFLASRYDALRAIGSAGGSTKGAITCADLKQFMVPQPPTLAEQHEIATALQSIDRKLAHHERKRDTLQELFKTLLHELMTGRIRVHELDIDITALAGGPTGGEDT